MKLAHRTGTVHISDAWSPWKRLRRRVRMAVFRLPDSGAFGLVPLRTHILICGFPRSGTTLLQLMLENGLPSSRHFGREVGGWRAATYCWRNHELLISKVPHDVFRLDPLRNFYAGRAASLRIILMVRDPRDVLTSVRKMGGPPGYVVGPERWRRHYRAFRRERLAPDVLEVRYEHLVRHPADEELRIEQFTGERAKVPFEAFHTIRRPDFDTSTLNGLRPLDQSPLDRWARPQHRARMERVLEDLPELPGALIELGYEQDTEWIEQWRRGSRADAPVCAV